MLVSVGESILDPLFLAIYYVVCYLPSDFFCLFFILFLCVFFTGGFCGITLQSRGLMPSVLTAPGLFSHDDSAQKRETLLSPNQHNLLEINFSSPITPTLFLEEEEEDGGGWTILILY